MPIYPQNGNQTIHAGAYGFQIKGFYSHSLIPSPSPESPILSVEYRREPGLKTPSSIEDDRARLNLVDGGDITLEREGLSAVIRSPLALTEDELAHPYLGTAAVVAAHWCGREPFHGGGIVAGGGAWAVLGSREGGKSTLLAAASGLGHPVVADDLLVVSEGSVFSGPRSIDLRPDALEHLSESLPTCDVRRGTRHRLSLGPIAASFPLTGFVFLAWGEEIIVREVGVEERLSRLAKHRSMKGRDPAHPSLLLDLTALPAYEFVRPKRWDDLVEACGSLISTLERVQPN